MNKFIHKLKKKVTQLYKKLQQLPRYIKLPLGIILILLWLVNIVNPFLNGVFIILLWTGLLSSMAYDIIKIMKKKIKEKKSHK